MGLIIARLSLAVLLAMPVNRSVVSLNVKSLRPRNHPSNPQTDCLEKRRKRRWPDAQTPMPAGTYPCDFGSVDLICANCVGGSLINQPVLCYPRVARAAGIKGVVQLKMVVDQRGNVVWTRVLKHVHYLLEAAANQEALQRKYKPFVCNGHAVKAVVYQSYSFK